MSNHAELCPVCKGSGKKYRYNNMYNMDISTTPQAMWIEDGICNGCPNGQGWITVEDTAEKMAEKSLPIALEIWPAWPPYPDYDYTQIYYG